MILIVDPPLVKRESEFILSQDESFVNPERETYITSSSTSSSSVEDANQKTKKKEQPVAGVCSTFSCTTTSTTTDKKCAPSQPTSAAAAAVVETSASETTSAGMSFLRNNFPFFRNSTSRSRSQSVVSDVSRSSETGDSKREKDKSYRRKSHLNRAFTDEPVPDNNYSLDHTPKSSKAPSQDPSSMENSAVEESRTKPAVKLHPVIPPVLTGKSGSPGLKPLSRNSSNKNFESTPSPVPPNSVMGKTQAEQNRKSTPVVKKDSFSDAEGVCFIKKMLQKESDRDRAAAAAARQNPHSSTTGNGSSGGYNIKKSPSAGNQSYWSKFSSSQPAFLRKLFEKPKISESPLNLKTTQKNSSNENSQSGESHEKDSEKENAEPAMGFSVAQKASFFMKLEHEQRFSRWRKNSVDFSSGTNITEQQPTQLNGVVNGMGVATNNVRETRPRSRYLTQPVTPTEVKELAPLVNLSALKLEGQDRNLEFGSQPRIWGNSYTSLGNFIADSSEKMSNDIDEPSHIPKSSYKDCDDPHKFEPIILGSLKERVNKFDEIVTRKLEPMQCSAAPTPTVKSYSLTRSSRNNNHINDTNNHLGGGFPMYHSASAIINTPAKTTAKPTANFYKYAAAAYSSSSSSFSEAVSRNDSTKFLPAATNKAHCKESYQSAAAAVDGNKRRSSVSEVELSAKTANRSPLVSRSEKVRSLFISGGGSHYDAETLSEDGEVSSGGQEVAEIICRSYENSPVFRKKTWRTQKQAVQTNFSKEIWRRCGNYENWNNRSYTNPPQQPQHPVPQTFTATTNVIEITTAAPPTIAPVSESPPMTSNLLQILTVLSSSNDELSESKPKSKKQRQGHNKQVAPRSDSDSIPPVHPGHQNNSSTNTAMAPVPTSSEIFVSVPHPEDEAFQSFFCSVKSYTKVTHFPPGVMQNHLDTNGQLQQQRYETNSVNGGASHSAIGIDTPNEVLDISSVRRESDLLVMKKNVPTAKRKSSGKYKNPLRALAARMDFRQQGYTQINNNAVQCSSDVDVTT
ncbi:hypothetical protein Ocin01_16818 [Orchesella cincta]|uniref:Uncharacterized protein n=1 Tax=Orchesella cincta TaxID=48709 RepID=A0A1D2MAF7_ORCCI|nr:hypothetical protein Ocin01_16818 [Orchesella cincta]